MTLFIDVSIVFFSFSFQDLLAFVKIKILKYYELVARGLNLWWNLSRGKRNVQNKSPFVPILDRALHKIRYVRFSKN